jgi:hypothetical protein
VNEAIHGVAHYAADHDPVGARDPVEQKMPVLSSAPGGMQESRATVNPEPIPEHAKRRGAWRLPEFRLRLGFADLVTLAYRLTSRR